MNWIYSQWISLDNCSNLYFTFYMIEICDKIKLNWKFQNEVVYLILL